MPLTWQQLQRGDTLPPRAQRPWLQFHCELAGLGRWRPADRDASMKLVQLSARCRVFYLVSFAASSQTLHDQRNELRATSAGLQLVRSVW